MDDAVIGRIASHDPRYVGHTPDGMIVLEEDGGRRRLTPAVYLDEAEPGSDEVFYATVDEFIDSVRHTNTTPTGAVVDVLLDLRHLFAERERAHRELGRLMQRLAFGGEGQG
jgi:hypothetical protein